jgi:hypothetical protein
MAALLPSRAPAAFFALLGAFLAGLAFFRALALAGATCARRAPTRAFLVAFGSAVPLAGAVSVCSVVDAMGFSPLAVITAVTTWIALNGHESKSIVRRKISQAQLAWGG